jgi:hypothetical protein
MKSRSAFCLFVLCLLFFLTGGCGPSDKLNAPPPNPPAPLAVLKTAEGKALAEKILKALAAKDATAAGALKKEVETKLDKDLRTGVGVNDSEYGILLGPLSLAEANEWEKAEKNLREIVDRSK